MSSKRMIVALLAEFAEPEPLQIQRHDSVLGETDTPLLLELVGVPPWPVVPRHVQNRRHGSAQMLRFVQKTGRKKPWDTIKSYFSDAIAVSRLNHAPLFELGRRVDPLLRPTMEDDVIH